MVSRSPVQTGRPVEIQQRLRATTWPGAQRLTHMRCQRRGEVGDAQLEKLEELGGRVVWSECWEGSSQQSEGVFDVLEKVLCS